MKVFKTVKLYYICKSAMTFTTAVALIITYVVCANYKTKTLGSAVEVTAVSNAELPVIIIDAGHGGKDGGCSAYDGTVEKDYNLINAKKLRVFFDMAGFETIMTRTEDTDTDGDYTLFNKKTDIKNRFNLTENIENGIFISIHANLSTSAADKGFTAFYGKNNENSPALAEAIRVAAEESKLCTRIRQTKKAPSTVWLQQHVNRASVLVECGFLSNPEDLKLLKDSEYQSKLMFAVFRGTAEYSHLQ